MKNLNIIITSGGTVERIDDARRVTNMATGKLGKAIAEEFLASGRVNNLFYICSDTALLPEVADGLIILKTVGVAGLEASIRDVMGKYKIDFVVHGMAVSDYCLDYITTKEDLKAAIKEEVVDAVRGISGKSISNAIDSGLSGIVKIDNTTKISSDKENLIIVMKKTPKIIGIIKQLQKDTFLVGFKLLVGVSKEELLDVGFNLLKKNNCDLVLANDLMDIKGDDHLGMLIRPDASTEFFNGKKVIAENLVNVLFSSLVK